MDFEETTPLASFFRAKHHSDTGMRRPANIFPLMLLINCAMYIESGVVPALLLQLTSSFNMRPGEQGLLGGIVFLSLSLGSPIAGYSLHHFDQQLLVGASIVANALLTLVWAMTPVNFKYSTLLFISVRALMGFTQAFFVVYIPLWTNENSPRSSKTKWMGYYQMTVPIGIITGYILSSIVLSLSDPIDPLMCGGLLCWRWPLLIEVVILLPIALMFLQLPRDAAIVRMRRIKNDASQAQLVEQSAITNTEPTRTTLTGRSSEGTALDEMNDECSPLRPPGSLQEVSFPYLKLSTMEVSSSSSSMTTSKVDLVEQSEHGDRLYSPFKFLRSIYDRTQSTSSSFTDFSFLPNPYSGASKTEGKVPIYYESFRDISKRTALNGRHASDAVQITPTDPDPNALAADDDNDGYYSGR